MILQTWRGALIPVFLTLLRVTVGVIMAVHGMQKASDPAQFIGMLGNMGIQMPTVSGYLAIAGELGGGLGLIFGLLTPIAAFGVFSTMAVAVFQVHWASGLLAKNGGFEYPLTLMMTALYFIARGGGPLSLDAFIMKNRNKSSCCG